MRRGVFRAATSKIANTLLKALYVFTHELLELCNLIKSFGCFALIIARQCRQEIHKQIVRGANQRDCIVSIANICEKNTLLSVGIDFLRGNRTFSTQ